MIICLARLNPQNQVAVAKVINCLNDPDADVADTAAWHLHEFDGDKKAGISILAGLLENPDPKRRKAAVLALSDFKQEAAFAIPKMKVLLSDSNVQVRQAATSALWLMKLPAEEGIRIFSERLRDSDPLVRDRAAGALKGYGNEAKDCVELIAAHLESSHGKDCTLSLDTLAEIGPDAKAAIPSLTKALRDPAFETERVAKALWKIGRNAELVLPALIELVKTKKDEGACDVIADIGPAAKSAVPALIEAVQSADWDLQWAAVDALGRIGPDAAQAVPALIEAAIQGHGQVPSAASKALAEIGKASVEPIGEKLQSGSKERDFLLDALAQIGPPAKPALPAVKACFEDKNDTVRYWAAIAYGKIDPDSLEPVKVLATALEKSNESFVRLQAALALSGLGEKARAALPVLDQMNTEMGDKILKKQHLRFPSLGDELKGVRRDLADLELWLATAIAIAQIDKRESMVSILNAGLEYSQTTIVLKSAEALGAIGPKAREALPELEKLSKHKDEAVQKCAREAIRKIRGESVKP
jgi:HEAT repeat protein